MAIGYSVAETDSVIGNIVDPSTIVFPVSLLFAFIGGLLLVRRLLRPINEVNTFLAAAATHPLSRELPRFLMSGRKTNWEN